MLDVLILGGGVTGCAAARWLSRYDLDIAVADASFDVAMGASRANSAIVHAGYDCEAGSMMARMNVRGNQLYGAWCEELAVPLGRCGSLVLAFSQQDLEHLHKLRAQGEKNGVPGLAVLSREETHALQPDLNPEVVGALHAPTAAITCPYELTQACARNAADNGVAFHFDWRAVGMRECEGGLAVENQRGETLRARYVINAAGVYADEVARMAGDHSFTIHPRKGEYILMDRGSAPVYSILFQTPSSMGKGVLVAPTVDGNVFAGPTAVDQDSREDTSVSSEGLELLRRLSRRTMPQLPLHKAITSFAGLRAIADTGDFVLGPSGVQPRLIHAAGICSPGLTSAPAIAEYMAQCLQESGLVLREKPDWQATLAPHKAFRSMTAQERAQAIEEDPLHARIVCRCETVTEAEIVSAIREYPGATTLDGVKRRTRAGMGRCQGGFCSPRVMAILAREMGVPVEEITKFGGGSRMVAEPLREEVAP